MAKKRVFEYARDIGRTTKEVLDILKKHEIHKSGHLSLLDEREMAVVEEYLKTASPAPASETADSTSKNVQRVETAKTEPAGPAVISRRVGPVPVQTSATPSDEIKKEQSAESARAAEQKAPEQTSSPPSDMERPKVQPSLFGRPVTPPQNSSRPQVQPPLTSTLGQRPPQQRLPGRLHGSSLTGHTPEQQPPAKAPVESKSSATAPAPPEAASPGTQASSSSEPAHVPQTPQPSTQQSGVSSSQSTSTPETRTPPSPAPVSQPSTPPTQQVSTSPPSHSSSATAPAKQTPPSEPSRTQSDRPARPSQAPPSTPRSETPSRPAQQSPGSTGGSGPAQNKTGSFHGSTNRGKPQGPEQKHHGAPPARQHTPPTSRHGHSGDKTSGGPRTTGRMPVIPIIPPKHGGSGKHGGHQDKKRSSGRMNHEGKPHDRMKHQEPPPIILDEDLNIPIPIPIKVARPVVHTKKRPEPHKISMDDDLSFEDFEDLPVAKPAVPKKTEEEQEKPAEQQPQKRVIELPPAVTVRDLTEALKVNRLDIIKKIMSLGIMNVNQKLGIDVATIIADEYGVEVKLAPGYEVPEEKEEEKPDQECEMQPRSPVVTIMGHVDHGKTSLLDAIRKTDVASGEAGGITQHIGAYQVELGDGKKITFLDTPGHEAFTAMRAQGAMATDIVVLVVAADDGVMPQTVEAIDHAIAAEVPIIVAINKIDKPNANVENVKKGLAEHGLTPEDWGGDTVCVEVSAKQKIGIDQLLEMILLVAEMRDLKANPARKASGVVIESKLDKGRGPVATVLVQKGTLKVGDAFVAGSVYGRVRKLQDDKGRVIKSAGPSTPVEVIGLSDVAEAGAKFKVVSNEKIARDLAEHRKKQMRDERLLTKKLITLDELFKEIQQGKVSTLKIIVKADVGGSVTAITEAFKKLQDPRVKIQIIHAAVGAISEGDVLLAAASNAIIIGFHVRPTPGAAKLAEKMKVDIRIHRVIYDAIDEVIKAMEGMLEPTFKEMYLGRAEVRDTFKVPKVGIVAGCFVSDGKVQREASVRVIRDGVEIYEGKIKSLKRFKDDVKEVPSGLECGIGIDNFNDIKVGDILEFFIMQEIKQQLKSNVE